MRCRTRLEAAPQGCTARTPATPALGCSAREPIDSAEAVRGIGSVRSGRASIGVHAAQRRLDVGSARPAISSANPRLLFLGVIVGDGLAIGSQPGESVVREVIAARLPLPSVELAGRRRGDSPRRAAAAFDAAPSPTAVRRDA